MKTARANNASYTEFESAEVQRRWLAGEKRLAIAAAIGRSEKSVGRHLSRLRKEGIVPPPKDRAWTVEEDEALIVLALQDLDYDGIAAILGRPYDSVKHRRLRLAAAGRLPSRKPGCPPGAAGQDDRSRRKKPEITPIHMIVSPFVESPDGVLTRTVRAV